MSNGDTGRKTHITRIFKNDDKQSDTWVDVERIDELNVIIAGRQRVHYRFDWENTEGMDKKQLVDPHDKDNILQIPIRKTVRLEGPLGVQRHHFLNDETNNSRKTHSRRVYYHAIHDNYLDGNNQPPSDPELYKQSLGNQDTDQFIDVEVFDAYWLEGDTIHDMHGHAARVAKGVEDGSSSVRNQVRKWLGTTDDPLLQEPLLESDVAGGSPGFQLVQNPDFGIIDPPWRIDPLQNIVNVHWGANVIYLTGDFDANIALLAWPVGDNNPTVSSLGNLAFQHNGTCYGSSFQVIAPDPDDPSSQSGPVFLLCGEIAQSGTGNDSIIMASKNTETWATVYTLAQIPQTPLQRGRTSIMAVVWDANEKMFFAAGHMANEYFVTVPGVGNRLARQEDIDILLRSKNGWEWLEISRRTWNVNFDLLGNPDKGPPPWAVGLLTPHCRTIVTDSLGNGVPDGIYYYKKEQSGQSLLIRPQNPPTVRYDVGRVDIVSGSQIGIEETSPDGEVTITLLTPGIPVTCVGYASGVITAVGGTNDLAQFAMTRDRGENWKKGSWGDAPATTITSARVVAG